MMVQYQTLRRVMEKSHAADYLGFIALLLAYTWIQFAVEPFHRMFSLDDLFIQYPYAEIERVPVSMMFVYAGGLPLIILIAVLVTTRSGWHKAHVSLLGLLISLVLTSFLTDVVKNTVGRPRPDLIARCKPKAGLPEHSLITIEACTSTDRHRLDEGWRSFPSGHSSFSFSGLGYLSLFLAGQLHVFRPRADLGRTLIALIPSMGALLIAISRLEDYRHDVYDVTIGSLLGATIAYMTYRRYYPPLRSLSCDVPYSGAVIDKNGDLREAYDEEDGLELGHRSYERMPLQEHH